MRPLFVTLILVLAACEMPTSTEGGALLVEALAGPTCPVETDPPDPSCAPRAVARARIVVSPADGRDIAVAMGETDAHGRLTLEVPVGDYIVTAGAVEGLMGAPAPVAVSVLAGEASEMQLLYDTGIR
jgi:hypothetical protein